MQCKISTEESQWFHIGSLKLHFPKNLFCWFCELIKVKVLNNEYFFNQNCQIQLSKSLGKY